MKESKLFNKTQTTNILLLPTSRNLLTRPRASSKTTDSFFLGFSSKYMHTCFSFFKFLWQQLNDYQALEEISSLIILSLCERKLLTDLTRDLHKQQSAQHKVLRKFLGTKPQIQKNAHFFLSKKLIKTFQGFAFLPQVYKANPNHVLVQLILLFVQISCEVCEELSFT